MPQAGARVRWSRGAVWRLVGKLVGYRAGVASAGGLASSMGCVCLGQREACLVVMCLCSEHQAEGCFGQVVVRDGREWSPLDGYGRRVEARVGTGDADVRREINWPRDGVVERKHVDDRGLEEMHEVARAAAYQLVG